MSTPAQTDYAPSSLPPKLNARAGFAPRFRLLLLMAAAFIVGGAILFRFDPSRYGFYPVCAFYRTTGLLCPGCGCLRALHHLLHGELGAAFHFNAFLIVSLPFIAALAFRWLGDEVLGKTRPLRLSPAWLWFGFGLLLAFTLLRNLPFAHSLWLVP